MKIQILRVLTMMVVLIYPGYLQSASGAPPPTWQFTLTINGNSLTLHQDDTGAAVICSGGYMSFSNYSSDTARSYQYQYSNSSGDTIRLNGQALINGQSGNISSSASSSYFGSTYGAYTVTGGASGSIYLVFTPYNDTNGSGTYDPGEPSFAPITIHFTVKPSPNPTITGPASECAGASGIIYSTEAGMNSYIWGISAGGNITGGSSTHVITVTWTTAGAQTVSVNYTNSNSCAAVSPTFKNVTVHPLPVPTITGPASACAGSTGITYSTEASMTGYVWAISAGGNITGGSSTHVITVTWTTAGAQTVSVNYTNSNSCTAVSPTVKNVTVHPLPVPTITGPASACAGSTGITYSTEASMNSYVWALSSGGTITGGSSTNTITVTWTTAGAQTVSVNYTNSNSCTAVTPTVKNVTVNPLPVPTITGPASACAGSTGMTYSTEAGMTGYVWAISAGGNITGGSSTHVITVTWTTVGAQTVSVNYTDLQTCTAVSPTVKNVNITSGPLPASVVGDLSVCRNQLDVVYDVNPLRPGYSYHWSLTNNLGVFEAGQGTNRTYIHWGDISGTDTLYLLQYIGSMSCKNKSYVLIDVLSDGAPGRTQIIRKPNSNMLICADSSVNLKYQWGFITKSSGITQLIPGATYRYVVLPHNFDTILYVYFVDTYFEYTGGISCSTRSYMNQYTLPISTDDLLKPVNSVLISPNPTSGLLNIIFPGNVNKEDLLFKLYDMTGKLLFQISCSPADQVSLNLPPGLRNGLYVFEIRSSKSLVLRTKVLIIK